MEEVFPIKKIVLWSLAGVFIIVLLIFPGRMSKAKKALEINLERARASEALAILSDIKIKEELCRAYNGVYAQLSQLGAYFNKNYPLGCDADHYFRYEAVVLSPGEFRATATRCTAGGKEPQAKSEYTIGVNDRGKFVSSAPELIK